MARRWWHYEPTYQYTNRQARRAQGQYDRAQAEQLLAAEVQRLGYDPNLFPNLSRNIGAEVYPGVVQRPRLPTPQQVHQVVQEKTGGGGLFGRVKSAASDIADVSLDVVEEGIGRPADYVTSKAFGGKVREPWDVLRPLKRAMDAEVKYIGRPVFQEAVVDASAPLIAINEGMSPLAAREEATRRIDRIKSGEEGGLKKAAFDIGGSLAVPSTFIGLGELGLLAKGGKFGAIRAIPALEPLLMARGSRNAVRASMGLPVYHGTTAEFSGLPSMARNILGGLSEGKSVFVSSRPEVASRYAEGVGGRILPLNLKKGSIVLDLDKKLDRRYILQIERALPEEQRGIFRQYLGKSRLGSDVNSALRKVLYENVGTVNTGPLLRRAGIDAIGSPIGDYEVLNLKALLPRYRPSAKLGPRGLPEVKGASGTFLSGEVPEVNKILARAMSDEELNKALQTAHDALDFSRFPRYMEHTPNFEEVEKIRGWRTYAQSILDEMAERGIKPDVDELPQFTLLDKEGNIALGGDPDLGHSVYYRQPMMEGYLRPEEIEDEQELLSGLREINNKIAEYDDQIVDETNRLSRYGTDEPITSPGMPYSATDRAQRESILKDTVFERDNWELMREDYIKEIIKRRGGLGGGQEPADVLKILQNLSGKPDDVFGVRSLDDVQQEAEAMRSLTQIVRHGIGQALPLSWVRYAEDRGYRFFDNELGKSMGLATLLPEANRVRNYGVSAAAKMTDTNRPVLEMSDFIVDDHWKITGLKGALGNQYKKYGYLVGQYLDDVIQGVGPGGADDFLKLPKRQQALLTRLTDDVNQTSRIERAMGLRVNKVKTPTGLYLHRQVKKRPVEIFDPRAQVYLDDTADDLDKLTEAVGTGPAVKARYGAKQSFQKPRSVNSHAEGVAAGIEYYPMMEAQRVRIVQGYNKISDKWLEAVLQPVGKKPTELLDVAVKAAASKSALRLAHLNVLEKAINNARRIGTRGAFLKPRGLAKADADILEYMAEAERLTGPSRVAIRLPINKSVSTLDDALSRWIDGAYLDESLSAKLIDEPKSFDPNNVIHSDIGNIMNAVDDKGQVFNTLYRSESWGKDFLDNVITKGEYSGGLFSTSKDPKVITNLMKDYDPSVGIPVKIRLEGVKGLDVSNLNPSQAEVIVKGPFRIVSSSKIGKVTNLVVKPIVSGRKEARRAALEGLQDIIRGEQKKAAQTARGAKTILAAKRAQVMAHGTEQFPRPFRGKFYPEQIGKRLEQELGGQTGFGTIENTLNKYNNFVRPIMATFDLSFLGVQGLLGLATNPVGYAQSAIFAMTHGYDDMVKQAVKSGTLDAFLKAGGHWAARNDMGEFLLRGPLEKVEQTPFKFNTWFTRFGNGMRLKLFEASMGHAKNPAELRSLARYANLATGFRPGKVTSLETAALFAPRFFRSQISLLSDAFTTRRVGGNQAARSLASLVAAGTLLTVGINQAQGQKTEMDPRNPNFMRIRAFGKDISVFGTWDSLARAVILSATNPEEGAKYFARSKASPAMSRIYDIMQGETFSGGQMKIDWSSPESILESAAISGGNALLASAPISAQQAFEQGVPTTPEELAGAGLQLTGTKATPLTEFEELQIRRDEVARENFNVNWEQLEPNQVYQLKQKYPDMDVTPTTDTGKAFAARTAIGERFMADQEALDQALPPGPEWLEQYKKIREQQAGAYRDWEAQHPEMAAKLKSQTYDNPNDQALQSYYGAFDRAKTVWGTLDPELLSQELDQVEAGFTPAQRAYVERNTGFKATPIVKEYQKDQSTLSRYYDIEDEVWALFQASLPELQRYPNMDYYLNAKSYELQQMGVPVDQISTRLSRMPLINRIEGLVSKRKEQLRRQDAQVDAALVRWYGATPISLQRRSGGRSRRRGYSSSYATR